MRGHFNSTSLEVANPHSEYAAAHALVVHQHYITGPHISLKSETSEPVLETRQEDNKSYLHWLDWRESTYVWEKARMAMDAVMRAAHYAKSYLDFDAFKFPVRQVPAYNPVRPYRLDNDK